MKTATTTRNAVGRSPKSEVRSPKSVSDRDASAFTAARSARQAPTAFTLIELLVVISVILVLAGLSFPALQLVKTVQARTRARGELTQIETAIETYKTKLGFYPPDNATNWIVNQLYYELMGTTLTTTGIPAYQTLDGSASLATNAFKTVFGADTQVSGFMNCAKAGAGDDAPNAVRFLVGLKDGQYLAITNGNSLTTVCLLGVAMTGPTVFAGLGKGELVPYGYNSSSPQHNPKSFDLWVDITAGGKTNRISNWSSRPIIISTPAYP
jgi:prepilin-type N-terminal cleavage/methylation domain-containing protein